MVETFFFFLVKVFFYAFLIISWKFKVQAAYLMVDGTDDGLSFHAVLSLDFRLSG